MVYLTATVVFVGLLCVLDLVLTIGVIRRLREQAAAMSQGTGAPQAPSIQVGEVIGEFATSDMDGEQLSHRTVSGETLVAFFAPNCQPCHAKIPQFLDTARVWPGGRERTLAVVVGTPDESTQAEAMAGQLRQAARVVLENVDGPLSEAFRVKWYPTVLLVGPSADDRLTVTDNRVALGQPVLAR